MFRTELSPTPDPHQLPRTARVLTMGSCFADSIGTRLAAHKVETLVNPFGTVFQPLSLGRLLRAAAGEDVDWQQHVVEARGRWQSYDLHGNIGADSPVALLQTIQEVVRRTGDFLRTADAVLVTLGTAWAYRLRETGELVNNCHKQPVDLFVRELLTPDDLINSLAETHAYLRRINPKLRFVLTVSPVRHLRDTLPLNAVSKSVLRVAAHFVSELLLDVAYFPAYELLLDDLRDYRFYAADMLHPSEVAEDYVWDKFARTYFDAEFGRFRKEWAAVRQSLGHRPLHAGAPEHRQFLESTLEKLEQLSLRQVAVADELREVRAQLAALPVLELPVAATALGNEDAEERIDVGADSTGAGAETSEIQEVMHPGPVLLPTGQSRLPRLSPEEFRAQRAARSGQPERGRREGRGKKNREPVNESEQFQEPPVADAPPETPDFIAPAFLAIALENEEPAVVSTALGAEASEGEDPVKKKKRRSRGGAKRTARKNALRLAAGEGLAEADATATPTAADSESQNASAGGRKPRVTAAEPVERGGQRTKPGRVPRTALFAAGAAGPTALPNSAPVPEPAGQADTVAAAATPANPRNGRNRNDRSANKAAVGAPEADTSRGTPTSAETAPRVEGGNAVAVVDTTNPVADAPDDERERGASGAVPSPQPSDSRTRAAGGASAEPAALEVRPVAAPVTARQSNRAKRVVSAARAEKPAVDTPVVPVPDALQVRTQVAAGRMTGSSASLVVPTAPKAGTKKAVPTKKAIGAKGATAPQAAAAPPAPAVAVKPPKAPSPVSKPKSAAKLKAGPAKPAAAKAPVTKPATAKAAASKSASAKPTAPKAAPKPGAPKPPKKPAKPA